MRWCESHRCDPVAREIADRHYNRQHIGAANFAPPGSCVVFLSDCGKAFWVTSAPYAEFVRHQWAGAWVCSAFRSEGAGKASELITQAVQATIAYYGDPPSLGMITFIDTKQVRPTRVRGRDVWGWTWMKAGFKPVGTTKTKKLLALQLLPEDMPAPLAAKQRSMIGMPLFDVVA